MNKRILFLLGLLAVAFAAYAADEASYQTLQSPSGVAGNSTNSMSTAQKAFELYDGQDIVRLRVSVQAVTSDATNGTFSVRFSTAGGVGSSGAATTNDYDTAAYSPIKLSITNISSSATNTVSDWFYVKGARYLRVGAFENSFGQTLTNITIWVESNRSQR